MNTSVILSNIIAGSDFMLAWITTVAESDHPALVQSISFGEYEQAISDSYMQQFNVEAMKLGVMGGEFSV